MTESAEFAPGIVESLPFETYQQAPGLNQSSLKHFYRPSNYHNPQGVLVGNAGHCLLLEPERFDHEYERLPEGVSLRKALREAEQSEERETGPTLLASHVWDALMRARTAVTVHPQASWMLEAGSKEVSLFWQEPQTGLHCKGRLDLLSLEQNFIADLKFSHRTAAEANTHWPYAFQAAWYRQGIYELTGVWLPFYLIFVERFLPYRVTVVQLEPEALAVGERLLNESLEEYQASAHIPEFDEGSRI